MIDRLLRLEREIKDLKCHVPPFLDLAKNGQRMTAQETRKNKKSSKGIEGLKFLMGQWANKGVVICESFYPRKDEEEDKDKRKSPTDVSKKKPLK